MTLRRILIISGIAVGVLVLAAGALTTYAFFNLSSIVARQSRSESLAQVSNELGRRVEVGKIQAQMGWGVSVEVSGLTIADDSSFSAKPFLAADDVSIEVEFFPLLRGEAKVTKLDTEQTQHPDRDERARRPKHRARLGIVPRTHDEMPSRRRADMAHKRLSLAELSIKALSIEDGEIYFNDLAKRRRQFAPITWIST